MSFRARSVRTVNEVITRLHSLREDNTSKGRDLERANHPAHRTQTPDLRNNLQVSSEDGCVARGGVVCCGKHKVIPGEPGLFWANSQ